MAHASDGVSSSSDGIYVQAGIPDRLENDVTYNAEPGANPSTQTPGELGRQTSYRTTTPLPFGNSTDMIPVAVASLKVLGTLLSGPSGSLSTSCFQASGTRSGDLRWESKIKL